jgi:hypothetical protein
MLNCCRMVHTRDGTSIDLSLLRMRDHNIDLGES